jgi:uncharacterized membrane protein YfcA
MIGILIASIAIFAIAIPMAMIGRGGRNCYVPILAAVGALMYQAATTGQLIIVATAITALLVFQKHKTKNLCSESITFSSAKIPFPITRTTRVRGSDL